MELADLAGFRGLAAISVIIFHAYQFCREGGTPYAGQFLGEVLSAFDGMISWFFLVSGFLLYLPMVDRVKNGRSLRSPKDTLIRRGLRILPLYYTALLVVWAARNPGLPGDWVDLVEHLTFTQVFDSERIFYTIGPSWSLAVEVFFYVYLAFVTGWLRRRQAHRLPPAHRWRQLYSPALILVAISAVWAIYAVFIAKAAHDDWAYWFSPQNYAGNFGFGMVVAIIYVRHGKEHPMPVWAPVLLRFAAAGLIILGALVRGHSARSLEAFHTLNSIGFALLFAASVLASRRSLWRRFFATRVFAWLGLISYSVYLWHEPILLLVLDRYHLVSHAPSAFPWVAAMLVVTGILAGWISFVILEKPSRRLSILLERLRRPTELQQDRSSRPPDPCAS